MGSNDGAEICELIGLYMLHLIKQIKIGTGKSCKTIGHKCIGLYRDDGLGYLQGYSGPQRDKIRKNIEALFKKHELKITIECNLKSTEFLDVRLDLESGYYSPYRKPDNPPLFIDKNSNHPPAIIKHIPTAVCKRLSELSSNEVIFKEACTPYQDALRKSGYSNNLNFINHENVKPRRCRKRNILWFNPPFTKSLKTDIGRKFLILIDKHFPSHNKYSKIFNRRTVKVSYSTTSNISSFINKHNFKSLTSTETQNFLKECNCRVRSDCPLDNKCLSDNMVYKADVNCNDDIFTYYGLTAPDFKKRIANHNTSFKNVAYKGKTSLSTFIWSLKNQNKNFDIKWSIHKFAPAYKKGSKHCCLCLTEKVDISRHKNKNSLINSRNEVMNKCRHKLKYKLINFSPQQT